MGRHCSVCQHRDRGRIDEALVSGIAHAALSREFGLSDDALRRHAKAHLPATLAKAHEAAEVTRGDGLLGKLAELLTRAETLDADTERILRRAVRARDHAVALEAVRVACATIRERRGTLALVLQTAIAGVEAEVKHRLEVKLEEAMRQALTADQAGDLMDQVYTAIATVFPGHGQLPMIGAELQAIQARAFSREVPS